MTASTHFDFATVFSGVAQKRYARHLAAAHAAFDKRLADAVRDTLVRLIATTEIHVSDKSGQAVALWYKNTNVELFKIRYSGETVEISLDVAALLRTNGTAVDNMHGRTFEMTLDAGDAEIAEMLSVALSRGHVSEFLIRVIDELDQDGTMFSTEVDE